MLFLCKKLNLQVREPMSGVHDNHQVADGGP